MTPCPRRLDLFTTAATAKGGAREGNKLAGEGEGMLRYGLILTAVAITVLLLLYALGVQLLSPF